MPQRDVLRPTSNRTCSQGRFEVVGHSELANFRHKCHFVWRPVSGSAVRTFLNRIRFDLRINLIPINADAMPLGFPEPDKGRIIDHS